jgi:hypothetical protein
MPDIYKPLQPVKVPAGAVDAFLNDRGSVDEFLQMAWGLLAGALEYRTQQGEEVFPDLKLQVISGQLKVTDLANSTDYTWSVSDVPWVKAVLAKLAKELAEIFNTQPDSWGGSQPPWGFHKNVLWGPEDPPAPQ